MRTNDTNTNSNIQIKHWYNSYVFVSLISICTLALSFGITKAQENIFTAGFQYKPIFASSFFSTGTKTISQNGIDFAVSQKFGYCAGMVLRRGFTKKISFETGINYVKRNFSLLITDSVSSRNSTFSIIGYEIPLQGLIFIRLGEKLYMNTSAGISVDMYPSNIYTQDTTYFKHFSTRHSYFQSSALANVGFEYRTAKRGYFYLGASYHLPFTYFYTSRIEYLPKKEIATMKLQGNYLTLDLRYFFHEEIMKPKKKKKV